MILDEKYFHEKEKRYVGDLTALRDMEGYARNFRSGLYLFNNLGAIPIPEPKWVVGQPPPMGHLDFAFVAARDCAMSVYHFGQAMDGISDFLSRVPTFRNGLDAADLRSARSIFQTNFPWFIHLRHAIAHAAERNNTAAAWKKHSIAGTKLSSRKFNVTTGPEDRFMLNESLVGTQFSAQWKGQIYTCDVSESTANVLDNVIAKAKKVFEPYIIEEVAPTITYSETPPEGVTMVQIFPDR